MKKRALAFLLTLGVILSLTGCGGQSGALGGGKSGGEKTPEKTVERFIKALSNQDLDAMLSCCYIDEYFARVTFEDRAERLGSVMTSHAEGWPWGQPLGRELAVARRRSNFESQIRFLSGSLLLQHKEEGERTADWDRYLEYQPLNTKNDPQLIGDLVAALDYSRLKELKIAPVTIVGEEISGIKRLEELGGKNDPEGWKERMQNVAESAQEDYGVDDYVQVMVPLVLGEENFVKGFTLVQVDGRWQIFGLNASLAGLEESSGSAVLVR